MEILELRELNPHSLSLFGDVAQMVYRNDPVWASASESTFARQWSQRLRQRNEIFRPVVVLTQNQPCARAVAIRTEGSNNEQGEGVGFIGFFECLENQPEAARLVIDHCEQILLRAGVQSIQIPKVDNQLYGCQISDFGLPHVCLTAHNPPYYLDLFEAADYGVSQHIYSLYFTRENTDQVHVALPGFRTREFNRGRLDEEIERFHRLQQAIFGDRPGYVPRTLSQDRDLVMTLLPMIDDDLIIFAEDVDGRSVGILVCLPDYYQALAGQEIDRARIITIGALPKFAHKGLGALMGAHLKSNLIRKSKYVFAEGSMVLAHNIAPQNLAKRFQAKPGRRFVLLEKQVL